MCVCVDVYACVYATLAICFDTLSGLMLCLGRMVTDEQVESVLYVCVYVQMYVHLCLCVHVCVYVCLWHIGDIFRHIVRPGVESGPDCHGCFRILIVCKYACVCMYVCVCVCMCVCEHVCM